MAVSDLTSLWVLLLLSAVLLPELLGYTPGAYSITTAGDAFSLQRKLYGLETMFQQSSQQQSPPE